MQPKEDVRRRSGNSELVILLRSLLFVPVDSPRKIAKARTLMPDAFILDLEDSIAQDKKSEARVALRQHLANSARLSGYTFVRVNAINTSFFEDDLKAAVATTMDGIVLPKSQTATDLMHVDQEITRLESERAMPCKGTKLLPIIETAKGVVNAYEIAHSSGRVAALLFGPEDYCADMGIKRTRSGEEIAVARTLVSQAAHAAGVSAIDGVFTDFGDEEGLLADTRRAKAMGYNGKALIHPGQILPVHRIFAPADDELAWARGVTEALENANANGAGLAVFAGKMIDEAVICQARKILRQQDVTIESKS